MTGSYSFLLVLFSLSVACIASFTALELVTRVADTRNKRVLWWWLGGALSMGAGIWAMHLLWVTSGGTSEALFASITALTLLSFLGIALLAWILKKRMVRTGKLAMSLSKANAELRRSALYDQLTGLPNRALLKDRIDQAISHAQRGQKLFAVLFLDLDRFKKINDSLGHHVGDALLQAVATRLVGAVRKEDTVARLGGDEFVLVIEDLARSDDIEEVARKILAILAHPFELANRAVHSHASIGISVFPQHGSDAHNLMVNADAAMYHVKKSGRSGCRVFVADMNADARERLDLEEDLWRAIEQQQFELAYQPKAEVTSQAIVGVEALIRWRHPTRGLIPPAQFIPIAEDSGLIVPIGAWVLETACRQNQAWQQQGLRPVRIAVNVSASQFRQAGLYETVLAALYKSQMAAHYLELELTESVLMERTDHGSEIFQRLSDLGVHISIDDFGTGYSSLSYLKRLPLDKLKIDRSFVREITEDADNAEIVRAIVGLAHSLGLAVIAEGVETQAQLDFLRLVHCDQYQGYLQSRPLPAAEFEALLRDTAVAQPHQKSDGRWGMPFPV